MTRLASVTVKGSLLTGLALTIWGLWGLSWPGALPWTGFEALASFIIFLVSTSLTIYFARRKWHIHPLFAGAALALLLAMAVGAIWPVIVCIWFGIASAILGRTVISRLLVSNQDIDWITCMLAGAGIYGTVTGLIVHFPVSYPGLYGIALALPILLWWPVSVDLYQYCRRVMVRLKLAARNDTSWIEVSIAAIALIHFVVALMPEVMYDALATHLFVSTQLAFRHQWGFDHTLYVWALTPMLGDWIFSICYLLGGESGARLANVGFIFILAWLTKKLVLWSGGTDRGARGSILIFLTMPLTYTESSSLFIDSIWAAYILTGTLWFLRRPYKNNEDASSIVIASLMLGFASATKIGTVSYLPVLSLIVLYRTRVLLTRTSILYACMGVAVFVLTGCVPYLTAWLITDNPVFPFFNGIFKSSFYPSVNFDNLLYKSGLTWDLPFRVVFASEKYLEATVGAAGFQWLILLFPCLIFLVFFKHYRGLVLLAIGLLSVGVVFQAQSYLRYIFPATVILISMIGVALSHVTLYFQLRNWFITAVFATIFLNLIFFNSGIWCYRDFPLKVLLSETNRNQYIGKRLPIRRAVEFVNYMNPAQTPVAFFAQPFGAGLNADALYPNWYNYRFQKAINEAMDPASIVKVLSNYDATYVLLDKNWGTLEKRKAIEDGTIKIADFGVVSVHSIRNEYRFVEELLKNPDLLNQEGWNFMPGATHDTLTGSVKVTVNSPVYQVVSVKGGRSYRNTVTARCAEIHAPGRVQINWLNVKSQFISTDIRVFDCENDWTAYEQYVEAPVNAASGVVFATADTNYPIAIKMVSLR